MTQGRIGWRWVSDPHCPSSWWMLWKIWLCSTDRVRRLLLISCYLSDVVQHTQHYRGAQDSRITSDVHVCPWSVVPTTPEFSLSADHRVHRSFSLIWLRETLRILRSTESSLLLNFFDASGKVFVRFPRHSGVQPNLGSTYSKGL